MKRRLTILAAMVLAVTMMPVPTSSAATDFGSPGWWDKPSYTGPGDPDSKWSYPDFPVRCRVGNEPAWKVLWVDDDDGAMTVAERDNVREAIRRAMSMYVASAKVVFHGTQAGFQPIIATKGTSPNCQPDIGFEQVPTATLRDFWSLKAELVARGRNLANRKYLVLADTDHAASVGGESEWDNDSAITYTNGNNAGAMFSVVWRESDWSEANGVIAHEMAHSMGAVSEAAPNGDPDGHTYANRDLMADMFIEDRDVTPCPAARFSARLDCASSDYYFKRAERRHRPAGYLATHWSVTDNRFMATSYPSKPIPES